MRGGEQAVTCQTGQLMRLPMIGDIAGRRAQHPPVGREALRDEAGIGKRADPDGDVDSRGYQIDEIVGQVQLKLYFRIGIQKRLQMGGDVKPAEGRGGRDLRSEEHTSELQSLMRHSYAVF